MNSTCKWVNRFRIHWKYSVIHIYPCCCYLTITKKNIEYKQTKIGFVPVRKNVWHASRINQFGDICRAFFSLAFACVTTFAAPHIQTIRISRSKHFPTWKKKRKLIRNSFGFEFLHMCNAIESRRKKNNVKTSCNKQPRNECAIRVPCRCECKCILLLFTE